MSIYSGITTEPDITMLSSDHKMKQTDISLISSCHSNRARWVIRSFMILFPILLTLSTNIANSQSDDSDNENDDAPQETMKPDIDCGTYKARLSKNIQKYSALPVPIYKERRIQNFPDDELLSNYDFIQAVIGCNNAGMLEGFGATLVDKNRSVDWRSFITSIVQSLDENLSRSGSESTIADLSKEADSNARRNQSDSGTIDVGSYYVRYQATRIPQSLRIELRSVPAKR